MNLHADERRATKRMDMSLAGDYVIQAPANETRALKFISSKELPFIKEPTSFDSWEEEPRLAFHKGVGTIINMSHGGILLLLDRHPQIEQVIQVHIDRPSTGQTVSLLNVRWIRRASEDQYLAGCEFFFGPYSLSQDRICAPTEFVSP